MNFLRKLWKIWTDYFRKTPSEDASDQTDSTDPLARYLTSRGHFSARENRVKSTAFLPPPDLKLSVFQIAGLSENEIWNIGEECVSKPQGRTLYGRADLFVSIVQNFNLNVEPDNVPPRHANIVGWPQNKDHRKLLALELAARATLNLRP